MGDQHQAYTDIATANSEIYLITKILRRLKTPECSAAHSSTLTKVDINQLLTDLTQVSKTSFPASSDIEKRLELDPKLRAIICNANAIKQIYTNSKKIRRKH